MAPMTPCLGWTVVSYTSTCVILQSTNVRRFLLTRLHTAVVSQDGAQRRVTDVLPIRVTGECTFWTTPHK
jgi:hypothetical protein